MVRAGPVSVLIDQCGLALSNLLRVLATATLGSMPPLSLLFSSDEETSRVLIQALRELEFEVEHCPEIFAAVQRLTSRKLEVIVADWDDGLEASFLLKTSRELKSNSAAFTVALVSGQEAEVAARHLSVDCVLTKPFNVEQCKYALLTCDAFLARMREWVPRIMDADQNRFRNASPNPPSRTDEFSRGNSHEQVQRSLRSVASGPGSVLWKYSEKSRKARQARANRFLIAAIATTLLSCAYVAHDSRQVSNMAEAVSPAMQRIVSTVVTWSTQAKFDHHRENAGTLESPDMPASGSPRAVTHIRVLPAHRNVLATSIEERAPESMAEVNPELGPAVPVPQIPESLRTNGLSHASSGSVSSALLDAFEPVNITEDLSENLLVEKVQPAYPEQAVRSGLQGSVVLQALIGRDGRIQNLKLVQGSFLLGQSAFQAVKQWRYRPYFRNGRAVQAQTLVTVDFSLPTRSSATLPSAR